MDHHTSPKFYLSQWRAPLCEMRPFRGKVAHKYKHPGGTGYHPDIYETDGVPEEEEEEEAQDLEIKLCRRSTTTRQPRSNSFSQAWSRVTNSIAKRGLLLFAPSCIAQGSCQTAERPYGRLMVPRHGCA